MAAPPVEAPVSLRSAGPEDRDAVVSLAGTALGWSAEEPNAALFAWKHDRNPFGASPIWVAEADGMLVGVRVFLRWEFIEHSGRVVRAVRAVDTATHPAYQGRGIFRRLTLHAIDALEADGAAFVFNTPNDQSRPGYLKMGWNTLGRVPVGVAVRSPVGLLRMATARTPAGKWSLATDVGEDASVVLGLTAPPTEREAIRGALSSATAAELGAGAALITRRTPEHLRWRYASGPLAYRVLRRGRHLDDGFAVFRLRRRGAAAEATICDIVHPDGDPRVRTALVRAVLAETGADYAIAVAHSTCDATPMVRLPGLGPIFTWRALRRRAVPPLPAWSLRLGDIELF